MNICYLGLGSNQKYPERQIRQAIKSIKALRNTSVSKVSSLYWNKAWGLPAQQDFCNVVLELFTFLPPSLLLKKCNLIENQQGRIRRKKWGPRTLDVDILLYEERKILSHKLKIPHPHMLSRDFVILPLLEINPLIKLH